MRDAGKKEGGGRPEGGKRTPSLYGGENPVMGKGAGNGGGGEG